MKLARIAKTVTFKSSRTDMEFSRIEGTLDLDSDDLHAEQITGPLHLTTRSKNIRLEEVSGDVRLQDDNGAVEIGMRTLGNVQIDNRNGDIQLSLPDKAGFRARCPHPRRRDSIGLRGTENQQRRARSQSQRQRRKCVVAHRAQQ